MGHFGRDPLDELRAYARRLDAESEDAHLPIDTLGPVPVRLPLRAASATSAPILFAITAALAVLLFGGGAGIASAANGSIPGDRLYGIDLLVEDITDSLGLTSTHAAERFAEAAAILERGDLTAALDTAWIAAQEPIDGISAEDLQLALRSIESLAITDPALGTGSLQELLAAAAQVDQAPAEAGAVIAQIARAVPPAVVGAVGGTPGQDPEFTPPGREGGSTPPGQDPELTPPGQDPQFTPPGQDPEATPPGQDPQFTPPGQDPEVTPPGQGTGNEPKGEAESGSG